MTTAPRAKDPQDVPLLWRQRRRLTAGAGWRLASAIPLPNLAACALLLLLLVMLLLLLLLLLLLSLVLL